MIDEYIASGQIPLHLAVLFAGIFSCVMLWQIKDPKTPRWVDFTTAVSFLLFSAIFLGIVTDLQGLLPLGSKNGKSLKTQFTIALTIVPFFTAALASNLLSNLVLSQRDYKDTYSFGSAVVTIVKAFCMATVILGVIWLGYEYVQKTIRKN